MHVDLNKLHHRFLFILIWTSFLYIGYQLTNHYPLVEPYLLPLSTLDKNIPFLLWTVIPYLLLVTSMYLLAFIDHRDDFIAAIIALTIAVSINYTIYLFYPTIYPRPPISNSSGLAYDLYLWLTSIDSPKNCLPSGHITTPAITCWYLVRQKRSLRIPCFLGFAVLSLTTLTTKQHYAIDIPAGLLTAFIGIVLAKKIIQSQKINLGRIHLLWRTN